MNDWSESLIKIRHDSNELLDLLNQERWNEAQALCLNITASTCELSTIILQKSLPVHPLDK